MPTPAAKVLPPALRFVRDEDGPVVAALIMDCFAEYAGCLFSWDEFPELKAPASWAASRGTEMWVAESGGAVIGCICGTAREGAVELHKFYVASSYRGSGLADSLAAKVFTLAERSGAGEVFLWTDTRFARAHRFYEKHGFRRQPGTRLLHDISNSIEFHYSRPWPPAS